MREGGWGWMRCPVGCGCGVGADAGLRGALRRAAVLCWLVLTAGAWRACEAGGALVGGAACQWWVRGGRLMATRHHQVCALHGGRCGTPVVCQRWGGAGKAHLRAADKERTPDEAPDAEEGAVGVHRWEEALEEVGWV